MDRNRKWLIVALLAFAAVAALAWFLRGASSPASQAGAAAPATAQRYTVAQAQIVPIDGIIEVRPLSEGKVLRVLVQPGDPVKNGQLLAEIESEIQSAAVQQREADKQAAAQRLKLVQEGQRREERAALAAAAEAARNEAGLARDRWQRQSRLYEQGFVSQQLVIEAERNYQAAQARAREAQLRSQAGQAGGRPAEVRAAAEQVTSANAALSVGQVELRRTRIIAPVAGVIMTRSVNPGDIIGSNVTSPTLFKIVDPARVEVRLEIEELQAASVKVGLPVRFTLPGGQQTVGHGRISRVAPQVEKRSIGADDARIRADSMIRPAWSEFVAAEGNALPPVNFRIEAWIELAQAK